MTVTAVRLALPAADAQDDGRMEAIEQIFFDAGAVSVVLTDQRDDPVLEPKPGEVRLWPATQLEALFPAEHATLQPAALISLAARLGCEPSQLTTESIADRAWEREWLRDYQPLRFGERLWVCPAHQQVDDPHATVLTLDPGLAFGTGTHPTTRLCLEFIDSLHSSGGAPPPSWVVDYGCGSGILALAALRLGATAALVHDIDPQALEATLENAQRNGLASQVRAFLHATELAQTVIGSGGAPLVLANILAAPLIELAESLCQLLAPKGQLVLAGLLNEQADEVIAAYEPWVRLRIWRQHEGWACLTGQRP
jgi:ribosomal protein L11 methyltransferase